MSKMKLISMTDFVLEQQNRVPKDLNLLNNYSLIVSYANFLKQPLTLGMFVPCDEDGNLLEYFPFTKKNETNLDTIERLSKYELAKERVLFEGLDIDAVKHHISQNRNIEYLSNFGTLTLTPYALKQIGL